MSASLSISVLFSFFITILLNILPFFSLSFTFFLFSSLSSLLYFHLISSIPLFMSPFFPFLHFSVFPSIRYIFNNEHQYLFLFVSSFSYITLFLSFLHTILLYISNRLGNSFGGVLYQNLYNPVLCLSLTLRQ